MLRLCPSCTKPAEPTKTPFVLGINYWPRSIGVGLWKHFDVDAVHEDFATMSDLAIRYARVFLLWEDFQPDPETLRCSALSHLLELCDAAAAEGLKLELVFLSGHLGSANRVPIWLLDAETERQGPFPTMSNGQVVTRGILSPFDNALARRAAIRLVRGVARSVATHPAIAAYNLGNQPDLLASPTCANRAHGWFAELKEAISDADPKRPVTCSLSGRNLTCGEGLRVDKVFSSLDYSTIDLGSMKLGSSGGRDVGLPLFGCALTSTLSDKPTMLQELEVSSKLSRNQGAERDRDVAAYAGELLPALVEQNARGAVLWWFADTPLDDLTRGTQHLYGLFDASGELRPHARIFRDFAKSKPTVVATQQTKVRFSSNADDFYQRPEEHLTRLFEQFLQE